MQLFSKLHRRVVRLQLRAAAVSRDILQRAELRLVASDILGRAPRTTATGCTEQQ